MKKCIIVIIALIYSFLSVNLLFAATFSQADLTGTWNMNLLRTGSENLWMRGQMSINSAGVATCVSMSDSTGVTACPIPFDLTFTMNPSTGVITQSGYNAANAGTDHMTMTPNKNLMAGTSTTGDSPNYKYQLAIAQKVVLGTTYSNADVQNKSFVVHQLDVGTDNKWRYSTNTTDATGAITCTSETTPSGTTGTYLPGLVMSVNSNGIVTLNGSGGDYEGFLSDDKKTIVGTFSSGSNYKLMIIQITGKTYIAGTLPAHKFVSHILGRGAGAFWAHFTGTVNSSGVITYSDWVASNPAIAAPTGTFTGYIDTSGTITIDGNPTYHGQVSDDATFQVVTQTNGTSPNFFYILNISTKVPSSDTNLYGSFTSAGIWKWDGSSWTQVTPNNPQLIVTSVSGLYGSFVGAGIWKWDGLTWSQVTPNNPQLMVTLGSNLHGSFTGGGIWQWGGSSWSQVTPNNPQLLVASGSNLYGSFAGGGIWKWNGSTWSQVTPNNPQLMSATDSLLYGAFAGGGIWKWDGSTWSRVTPSNPEAIVASGSTLYGDFGSAGIWKWDGSTWNQVSPNTPQQMVASESNLYGSFAGGGIWQWDGSTWSQVTPNNPASMVLGN